MTICTRGFSPDQRKSRRRIPCEGTDLNPGVRRPVALSLAEVQGGQSSLSSMATSGAWERTWIEIPLMIERKARAMKKAAMGRLKKMNGDPRERSSDCWSET